MCDIVASALAAVRQKLMACTFDPEAHPLYGRARSTVTAQAPMRLVSRLSTAPLR